MSRLLTGAPWLHAMARVFDNAGAPLYLVGGAVRNPLMGLPVSDIDVCGPARAEAVCALCEGTPVRARLRAAQFGTVELYVTDETGEHMAEYTAWRQDLYLQGHRPDKVVFTKDISVDASRRDFTVNALYQRVHADGLDAVCDPTGGLEHLRQGLLHTVKPDPDLVLGEDGQRILRAVRFQAELDLVPTPDMLESMQRNAPLIGELSPEMMRSELEKMLLAGFRYPALCRRRPAAADALRTLHQTGAWPYVFGGIAFDESIARAFERPAGDSLRTQLALLLCRVSAQEAEAWLRRMHFTSARTQAVLAALQAMDGIPSANLVQLAKLGTDALCTAKAVWHALGDAVNAHAVQNVLDRLAGKPLSLRELSVTGSDLKPLFLRSGRPLRDMGAVLEALWLAVLEGRLPNEREALIDSFLSFGELHQ